jgi:endonuclease/exonuclease/phosphatase family metal-dependent hydrolase
MSDDKRLRVATYNVHGCVGTDGQRSEHRIAEVIAMLDVDLVGLQELDSNRPRSARVDQACVIANELGWHRLFHPAIRMGEEQYGNAILSRHPMHLRQAKELPSVTTRLCPESRAAIWAEIATPNGIVHVINTHLGLGRRERLMQAELLAGSEWLGNIDMENPVILMGDFNSLPGSPPHRLLADKLRDVRTLVIPPPRLKTFPTRYPLLAVDHIFVNETWEINSVTVVRSDALQVASDHFPIVADLRPA